VTRSKESLQRHKIAIERTLADVKAGKQIDHLCPQDVTQMIFDLENRLTVLTDQLT
jgi:hypothetical protein